MNKKWFNLLGLSGLFIISCSIFYFILFVPSFNIELTSSKSYNGQIFYKKINKTSYSESWSKKIDIVSGKQKIKIKLPFYDFPIRLDIANEPYQIEISKLYLSMSLIKIPLEPIIEQYQISNIEKLENGIKVKTQDAAFDPQLFFEGKSQLIELVRLGLAIFFGIVILFLYTLIKKYHSELEIYMNALEQYLIKINDTFRPIISTQLPYFGIYSAIAIVFHLFEISNFLISIDDEYSAFRTRAEAWVWDGRWVAYLIERFIFNQPTMPFVTNLLFCFFISLSYLVILRIHKIEHSWKTFILFPLYSAFPTLWFINEFYGNMVIVAFGFFVTSLSLLLFRRIIDEFPQYNFKKLFVASFILSVAIGAYQSFIMLALTIGFSILIFKNKYAVYYFINIAIFIVFSFIQYILITKLFKLFFPSTYDYVGGFLKLQNVDFRSILKGLFSAITNIYSGAPSIFGVSMSSLGYIFCVFFIVVILFQKKYIYFALVSLTLMLISPFLLNFFTGGNQLPTRSFVSIPYVVWFASFVLLVHRKKIINLIGLILIFSLYIQIFSALGQYAAATQIGQIHDRILAADLYRRMGDINPHFDRKKISIVDIYGYKKIETVYPYVETSTINASFFDWDGGNISRMLSYMKLLGYINLRAADQNKMLENIEYFQKMPSWPNKDSVRFSDGVYLIKISEEPDVNHKVEKK